MRLHRHATAFAATALLAFGGACGGSSTDTDGMGSGTDTETIDPTLTSIAISPDPVEVEVSGSAQLTVTGTFDDGSTSNVTAMAMFSIDDDAVAMVSNNGAVAGVAEGTATITADVGDITDTVAVTVGPDMTGGPIALPMAVDDFFLDRSAFGSDNGGPLHTEDDQCPMRAGDENGSCHRFVWDGGGMGDFTGTFWTSGSAFTDLQALEVETGATEVSFWAWGETGGERIEFGAGIGANDGAEVRQVITLTTTPTEYSVRLANGLENYTEVFGPFVWAASNDNNPDGATFFVDDIEWVMGEPPPSEIALPMTVDEHYMGRSAFGSDNGGPLHMEDDQCPMRAGGMNGDCHRFVWDGGGPGAFTGTFWTDGEAFMNLNGPEVEAGATEVAFWAWGENGGERIEFGAGINANDGVEVRQIITLSTTPTRYAVSLSEFGDYDQVFAPFIWAASNDNNPAGATFFVDDIQWVVGDPPPEELTLPMIVDTNYPDRSGFGPNGAPTHTEDDQCPMRAGAMEGECHRFQWNGTEAFTGTFWTVGESFMNLQGLPIESGATTVSFWAWGANGGETVTFGAGIGDAPLDGAEARGVITLTTTPTRYFVNLSALGDYDNVFGAFIWAADNMANPAGFEFYVDDIQWTTENAPSGLAIPMTVDDHYMGRSGFGPAGAPTHTEDAMCPMRAGMMNGNCHRFVWDGSVDFTGVFFTDGNDFNMLNGPLVDPGATELQFMAWGENGGEIITFGAGIGDAPLDGAEVRTDITLTTTPTRYGISLAGLGEYTNVFGPFIWAANNGANPGGFTFYVDDIQWLAVAPSIDLRPDANDGVIVFNGGAPSLNDPFIGGANIGDAEGGSVFVVPFVLPTLPAGGFTEANLNINVIATAGAGDVVDLGGDLYGLPYRTAADTAANGVVLASMFYADNTVDPSATLLVDNFLSGTTPAGLLDTDAAGDTALVDYLNAQVAAGAVAGDFVYLRISPDSAPPIGGGYTWVVSASVDNVAPPERPTLTVR